VREQSSRKLQNVEKCFLIPENGGGGEKPTKAMFCSSYTKKKAIELIRNKSKANNAACKFTG
jgi:hypothetical protein